MYNSATTTTTTIQVQPTPYNHFCFPETCGSAIQQYSMKGATEENNTLSEQISRGLKRRAWEDAPERTSDPPDGQFATQKNYGGRGLIFLGEVARAYRRSASEPQMYGSLELGPTPALSSYTRLWADKATTVALAGLVGCTAVVIISVRGFWLVHIWETHFTGHLVQAEFIYDSTELDENGQTVTRKRYFPAIFEDEGQIEARFERDVLDAMAMGRVGDPYHRFGLSQLREKAEDRDPKIETIFDPTMNVQGDPFSAVILTPKPLPPLDRPDRDIIDLYPATETRYPSLVRKILLKIRTLMPAADIETLPYNSHLTPLNWPHNDDPQAVAEFQADVGGFVTGGKMLIQYQPSPGCDGMAWYRFWFEGKVVFQKKWKPSDFIPNFSSSSLGRRDNSTACDISEVNSSTSIPPTTTTTPMTTPAATTTKVTLTAPSSTGLQETAPASPVSCYNSQKRGCYHDVDPDTAYSKCKKFCSDYASINGFGGPNWPGIQSASNDFPEFISYNWKIERKPDCVVDDQDTGTEFNVGQCLDAMREVFDDCNNGGHGGTKEYGCLSYHFSPVNQGVDSCSVPFS
ncbi:hypothetical protein GGR54DRAFT_598637 [Hypoxylon sp. NC1633]|nr:hypothetical protein GGR54DRAFT_598637 [Hypoxylon sp. NC1633]